MTKTIPSVVMLWLFILSVVMLSATQLGVCAEFCYAVYSYAKCRYAECCYAVYNYAKCRFAERVYAAYSYAKCHCVDNMLT